MLEKTKNLDKMNQEHEEYKSNPKASWRCGECCNELEFCGWNTSKIAVLWCQHGYCNSRCEVFIDNETENAIDYGKGEDYVLPYYGLGAIEI